MKITASKSGVVREFMRTKQISGQEPCLTTSERSPFGRICRLYMITHAIPFELRILNFVDDAVAANELRKETPINKVPILTTDDGSKIFDSRVIIEFLRKRNSLPELSLENENRVSAIYSCLDVSVILFLMRRSGYDLTASNFYLDRQKERLPRNLDYLRDWAEGLDPAKPADWNYASMSLLCFLEWASARAQTIDLAKEPVFEGFLRRFSRAPGVFETKLT